jgi:ethanolamine utilization protein EutN
LGRVIGTVVATEKTPDLEGVRFLIVQPLTRDLADRGRPVIAADGVHMAGPGELIYFVGSREAAQAMPEPFVPVDHAIVGIVDQLAVEPLPPRKKPVTRKPAARKPVARKPVARKPAAKKAGDK